MTVASTVFITSPLEPEHVERIRAVDPRIEVIFEPELLPETRYIADHKGKPITRTGEALARWQAGIARADILWDLPAAEDLARAERLRWVQTTSTGVGQAVARLGLREKGVIVTTARGVHARPLAEFVFMALLAHFRGLRHLEEEQRARRWERVCNEEIAGRTLVLLGAGDLARGCARVAKALDMRVVAVARDAGKPRAQAELFDAVMPVAQLHEALAAADAFVVTVPHTAETEGLVDAAAFAAMRPGIAFVNIGRGQVVDEAALIAALREGRVGYAALDVALVEPLPAESPLWSMPNVLISPHSASTVRGENARITEVFCGNLRCWLDGRPEAMRNRLDPALLY
ncbi:D-2-hydroxyacid dehydrogenase [Roseomonas sp. BN140053]|uniref:D-2-hydroxyacid dehydrogenase n=1 Tax=Roseomonas sp. BN140053 TaxID=3391898 RepID=UPI0039E89E29